MGVSAAVAIGAALAGPKLLEATGIMKKPEAPALAIEQAPAAASADPKGPDAQAAADQQRKRAAAAGGRSDTIKTGPQGLGSMPMANVESKTLLGY